VGKLESPTGTFVIAEAGVNHNGDLGLARELVATAAEAGADCVKFQTFRAKRLLVPSAPKAAYQLRSTPQDESQYSMLQALELSASAHRDLIAECKRHGIAFLSTPFDLESLDFLTQELGLRSVKISSGEITNGPLLLAAAVADVDIILSTGMACLGEIEEALSVLAFGYRWPDREPSREGFRGALGDLEAWEMLSRRVRLLQCTTEYPAPYEQVDLRALATLREAFGVDVGLSDHTPGIAISLAAVGLGAAVIEKHFTLDRTLSGPDHRASLEPRELSVMVEGIRQIEAALGSSRKVVRPCEVENRKVVRKSLAVSTAVAEGEAFEVTNLTTLRPGTGLSPMRHWDLLKTPASRDYSAGEMLD
jgi:N-acetylneuraminate synthase